MRLHSVRANGCWGGGGGHAYGRMQVLEQQRPRVAAAATQVGMDQTIVRSLSSADLDPEPNSSHLVRMLARVRCVARSIARNAHHRLAHAIWHCVAGI